VRVLTPVPDEGEGKIGVGPLIEVEEPSPNGTFPYNFVYHAIPSGVGVFSFHDFEREYPQDGAPACAIKTPYPEVCASFSFAHWKEKAGWPGGWLPSREAERLEAGGKLAPSPARWQRFSPGQQGVYACREISPWASAEEPLVIDFLRPDGTTEVFLQDGTGRFSDAAVVEVPGGHLGIFRRTPVSAEDRMYRSVGSLVAAPIVSTGKERRIGDLEELNIGDVWFDGRAADARDARKIRKRAGYGPFRPVALTDTSGKPTGEVVLLWVEAIPPPDHNEMEERKQKQELRRGKGKNQCGKPDTEAFRERSSRRRPAPQDGCGGRMSRPLSNADVKKRLHLTKLSSLGRSGADRVVDLPASYDAERRPLNAFATSDGGLVVDDMTFDRQLRRGKDVSGDASALQALAAPPLSGPPPQRLLSAAFDPASGEAAIIYAEAVGDDVYPSPPLLSDMPRARVVSALGKPVGKPLKIAEFQDHMGELLAIRGGETWFLFAQHTPDSFRILGGAHHGAQHPIPTPECDKSCPPYVLGLLPTSDARVEVLWSLGYGTPNAFFSSILHPETLLATLPRQIELSPGKYIVPDDFGVFRSKDGSPALWTLKEDGSATLTNSQEGGQKHEAPQQRFTTSVHQVWGDVVVVASTETQARATWLKAGVTVDFEPDKLVNQKASQKLRAGESPGPVLKSDKWLLPSAPGQLIPASTELQAVLENCPVRLPTGPRRLLLACSEATSDQLPSVRVGTRVVRY
jgi:hypothetical protein